MKAVHRKDFVTKGVKELKTVPNPPAYLSASAKNHYKTMAEILIKADRLTEIYLPALEVFADAMAQFEWAIKAINRKNRIENGSGFIQTYESGATNISTELVVKREAEATLFKCFKQFGMEPRSEKELKEDKNPNQLDLFETFLSQTS